MCEHDGYFSKVNHDLFKECEMKVKMWEELSSKNNSAPQADSDLISSCKGADGEGIESEHIC